MNFDELLKTLHQDYLSSLPKKIVSIREQLQTGNASELRESFHKLKGTGRTYGMPEVSELAALVESICNESPTNAVTATGHALDILQDIYDTRMKAQAYALDGDPRFAQTRKLLQK